jgi:hypothetical protein
MSHAIAKQASETSGYPVSYIVAWLVSKARPLGMIDRFVMFAFVMAASKYVTPYSS